MQLISLCRPIRWVQRTRSKIDNDSHEYPKYEPRALQLLHMDQKRQLRGWYLDGLMLAVVDGYPRTVVFWMRGRNLDILLACLQAMVVTWRMDV